MAEQVHLLGNDIGLVQNKHGVTDTFQPTVPAAIEDVIILIDIGDPIFIAAPRLSLNGDSWKIQDGILSDQSWHGATVIAEESGQVIGILSSQKDGNSILPFHQHVIERLLALEATTLNP